MSEQCKTAGLPKDPTRAAALAALLQEESDRAKQAGVTATVGNRIHPSGTISAAIDLEEQQYVSLLFCFPFHWTNMALNPCFT